MAIKNRIVHVLCGLLLSLYMWVNRFAHILMKRKEKSIEKEIIIFCISMLVIYPFIIVLGLIDSIANIIIKMINNKRRDKR